MELVYEVPRNMCFLIRGRGGAAEEEVVGEDAVGEARVKCYCLM